MGSLGIYGMGHYEISALPWSSRQRICRWNFKEFWQVSGSAVIDESFHNQFEWAPFTNGVAVERGTSRPRHRWHRLTAMLGFENLIWLSMISHVFAAPPMFFKVVNSYLVNSTQNGICIHIRSLIPGVSRTEINLIPRSDFLLLLSKSWSKSDRHRSYFLSLKADIWLDWVAKLCS